MFIHLVHSDPKFPALIRNLFEKALPGQNIYCLLGHDGGSAALPTGYLRLANAQSLADVVEKNSPISGVVLNGINTGLQLVYALPCVIGMHVHIFCPKMTPLEPINWTKIHFLPMMQPTGIQERPTAVTVPYFDTFP
jgi:hypothetical protein